MDSLHENPLLGVRLSKQPPYEHLVSFGNEQDTQVKLWDTRSNAKINQIDTKKLQHYHVCSSKSHNYFSVASWTADLKIYSIDPKKN